VHDEYEIIKHELIEAEALVFRKLAEGLGSPCHNPPFAKVGSFQLGGCSCR
jgi:hypothetical protein